MRRIGLIIAALAVVGALGWAAPASAHADLRSTTPASGAVLPAPPRQVTMTFSERVELTDSSVQVFDGDGQRVDDGRRAHHAAGRPATVVVDLPDGLARGGYVVTWRVVSADAHPIHGAFTFSVGRAGGDVDALARRLVDDAGTNVRVAFYYGLVRALSFGGFLIFLGGLAFGERRVPLAGALGAAVGTVIALPLHALEGAGLALGHIADGPVLSAALDGRYGQAAAARVALLGTGALLLVVRPARPVLYAIGVLMAATFSVSGHAATGRWVALAMVTDVLHLVAGAVWVGGLVALIVHLVHLEDEDQRRAVAARFSRIAMWAVVVVVATGTVQAFRQVGELDALTGTRYGHLLAIKVGLVAAMVVAAVWSRRWARAGESGSIPRSVLVETAVAVLVVGVTAALMNAPPGRTALAKPFAGELTVKGALVDVSVEPARRGLNDLHVYLLTPEGQVRDAAEITASVSLPSKGIGPIRVPLRRAAPGHFSAYGFSVPLAGRWTLDVSVRFDDITQETARTTMSIR